jgi:hypothetical protein
MAVTTPAKGGTPDALAIPKQRGNAINDTIKPAIISSLKWAFNPAIPVLGKF